MSLRNEIFSVRHKDNAKVIKILGIRLVVKDYISYLLWSKFIECFFKIKKNKVVLCNISSHQYSCNIKYIGNELISEKNLDLVFLYYGDTDQKLVPKEFRRVKYGSYSCLRELMTAKAWVFNSHSFLFGKGLKKRQGTLCFQTFHGSMGIKKIDADCIGVYKKLNWDKRQYISASNFDFLFTDSKLEGNIFRSAFWGFGEIKYLGKARDCIFYKKTDSASKVREFYKISKNQKIVLYAPTWRVSKSCNAYNIDVRAIKRALKARFNSDFVVLVRSHIHMKKDIFNALWGASAINASKYPDMQELMVASDVLISDYSSCLPEYVILKKPSFIYANDLETYENGFYYPLSILPSPLARDNYELVNNILNFNEAEFLKKADEFLQYCGHKDDANSAIRIKQFILEKINE